MYLQIYQEIIRSSNYIGKSNWNTIPNDTEKYDDLKFFNRALNKTEIFTKIGPDF